MPSKYNHKDQERKKQSKDLHCTMSVEKSDEHEGVYFLLLEIIYGNKLIDIIMLHEGTLSECEYIRDFGTQEFVKQNPEFALTKNWRPVVKV
jgi:hypothetical protein